VQSSVKLASLEVAGTGERTWISSQKVPVVRGPPSVHVSAGTLCVLASLKSSVDVGPVAPSLRIQR
jgi:hypothetical protein